jgi:hypothetical protein
MVNRCLKFGFGHYGPQKEGACQDRSYLPHDDDGHTDQIWDSEGDALTSATYTSAYAVRSTVGRYLYPRYRVKLTVDFLMANHQDSSRLPNDDDGYRDLPNPEQGWNPDNDTLTSATFSSSHAAHNAPQHNSHRHDSSGSSTAPQMPMFNTPNDGPEGVSDDDDADTVIDDSDLPPVNYSPPILRPLMPQRRLREPHYGGPFITLTESQTTAIDTILAPVLKHLITLKETTLSDYHPGLRARS